jgi:hypothetical protein
MSKRIVTPADRETSTNVIPAKAGIRRLPHLFTPVESGSGGYL